MAKAISDEEVQLKKRARRRLVGAITLVLIVVVFLPMVLDNEPRPLSEDIEISIPNVPSDSEAPAAVPAPAPLPYKPVEPPDAPPSPAPVQPAQPSAPAQPAPAPAPAKPAEKPPAQGNHVVQLAAFSNAETAKQLVAKVRQNGFKAYTEAVSTPNGQRTRVRVGPYPSKEAAEKARDRLKALKLTLGEPDVLQANE